jgi:hypothetical protein
MIRMQNKPFDICRTETEHPRLAVINPDNRMIVLLSHDYVPFLAITHVRVGGTRRTHADKIRKRTQRAFSRFSSSWDFRYIPDIGSTQQR